MGLTGKVCLITGAAGGLGSATARRLAVDGVRLVLMDVDGDRVAALAEELPGPAVMHAGDDFTHPGRASHKAGPV